ncbi:hypothetical protein Dimus_006478, partial [Dionaea muscipula]
GSTMEAKLRGTTKVLYESTAGERLKQCNLTCKAITCLAFCADSRYRFRDQRMA